MEKSSQIRQKSSQTDWYGRTGGGGPGADRGGESGRRCASGRGAASGRVPASGRCASVRGGRRHDRAHRWRETAMHAHRGGASRRGGAVRRRRAVCRGGAW
jgi:hypothetical protein